jgi:hypothetical protein
METAKRLCAVPLSCCPGVLGQRISVLHGVVVWSIT